MDLQTGDNLFSADATSKMQRVESKEEFMAFWDHLKAQGLQVKSYAASDPPVAWIADAQGVVVAKWYHEFGPTCPHEFWVDQAMREKVKGRKASPENQGGAS